MELTETWREVFPEEILERFLFAETRSAAAVLQVTAPGALEDIVGVLKHFQLSVDHIVRPGGNKSRVARELDHSFRSNGWREGRYDQDLTTTLTFSPWQGRTDPPVTTSNQYGGHKIDNVLGRAVLDVEWNPKDGNLDRDFMNYVSLHEGGAIDVGVILTRSGEGLPLLVRDVIAQARAVEVEPELTTWHERMRKTPINPLGTATTANFERLQTRLARGDGRGCPMLAIAITERCYVPPPDSVEAEVLRLASALQGLNGATD